MSKKIRIQNGKLLCFCQAREAHVWDCSVMPNNSTLSLMEQSHEPRGLIVLYDVMANLHALSLSSFVFKLTATHNRPLLRVDLPDQPVFQCRQPSCYCAPLTISSLAIPFACLPIWRLLPSMEAVAVAVIVDFDSAVNDLNRIVTVAVVVDNKIVSL